MQCSTAAWKPVSLPRALPGPRLQPCSLLGCYDPVTSAAGPLAFASSGCRLPAEVRVVCPHYQAGGPEPHTHHEEASWPARP